MYDKTYQRCEALRIRENTTGMHLTCTASSKPRSTLSWTIEPANLAIDVDPSIPVECNTTARGIVTCVHKAYIAKTVLGHSPLNVTCHVEFNDKSSVVSSTKACVAVVPYGTYFARACQRKSRTCYCQYSVGTIRLCLQPFELCNIRDVDMAKSIVTYLSICK